MSSTTTINAFAVKSGMTDSEVATATYTITNPTPTITVSPSSVSELNYIVGQGPSEAQNITLGGSNLTASVTINAPENFEVSIDGGSTYGDSRTVTQTGGEPEVTTVKVRMKSGLAVAPEIKQYIDNVAKNDPQFPERLRDGFLVFYYNYRNKTCW